MRKLKFEDDYISKVLTRVSTMSYAVLVNGQLSVTINPTKGLHQGDPISCYLYLICAEGLSSLLHEAEVKACIKGFKVARNNPTLTHIFFADDSIVYCNATTTEWLEVEKVLKTYEYAADQGINKHKSGVFFSSNTSAAARTSILQLSGVMICHNKRISWASYDSWS